MRAHQAVAMNLSKRLVQGLALAPLLVSSAIAAPFENATVRRIIDGREVYIDKQLAKVNCTHILTHTHTTLSDHEVQICIDVFLCQVLDF